MVISYLWLTIPAINNFLIHQFPHINDARNYYLQVCNSGQTEQYIIQNCSGATPMGSWMYSYFIAIIPPVILLVLLAFFFGEIHEVQ